MAALQQNFGQEGLKAQDLPILYGLRKLQPSSLSIRSKICQSTAGTCMDNQPKLKSNWHPPLQRGAVSIFLFVKRHIRFLRLT